MTQGFDRSQLEKHVREMPSWPFSAYRVAAKSRRWAGELIGEGIVDVFDRDGYVCVRGSNGHPYWVFDRVPSDEVGQQHASSAWRAFRSGPASLWASVTPKQKPWWAGNEAAEALRAWFRPMEWLVFGRDWRLDERVNFSHPDEHFHCYGSFCLPKHDELASLVVEIRTDVVRMLKRSCDPVYDHAKHYPTTRRLLKLIGRKPGPWCWNSPTERFPGAPEILRLSGVE